MHYADVQQPTAGFFLHFLLKCTGERQAKEGKAEKRGGKAEKEGGKAEKRGTTQTWSRGVDSQTEESRRQSHLRIALRKEIALVLF